MKKLIIGIMMIGILLVGCSEESLVINGQTIHFKSSDYKQEQIEALKQVEANTSDIRNLIVQGIFTRDELLALGLEFNTPNNATQDNAENFLSQLDLNTLSSDQLILINQLKAEEITLQDLLASGLFDDYMSEDEAFAGRGQGMNKDTIDLKSIDLSSFSEEQQAALEKVIDGQLSFRDLMEAGLFTQEEIRQLTNK